MRLKQRIKNLERLTGATDKFCRCGTPYIVTFVIGGEDITCNVCPDCGRDVRPRTRAEFVIDDQNCNYEFEVIEPTASETIIETK